jgi:metallopeptidase family M12-like protein/disintegrin
MHINYIAPDGTVRMAEPIKRHEHKVFRGQSFVRREGSPEWSTAGWARITVHRDGKHPVFEGAFSLDGDNHHIQTGENYRRLKHAEDPVVDLDQDPTEYMLVWRDSDVHEAWMDPLDLKRDVRGRSSCTSDELQYNADYRPFVADDSLQAVSSGSLFGRQMDGGQTGDAGGAGYNLVSTIGNPTGCPNTRKIALMGVATDCGYTASFNSSQSARANIIAQVNSASQVYESAFNISLGIQNLTISEGPCPSSPSSAAPWNQACDAAGVTISTRLNLFSAWRGLSADNNAFWTLLSTCNTNSAVGLAWLGQACVPGSQRTDAQDNSNETVASANVVVRTSSEWQVLAHEVGHTFGAVHDCDESACATTASRDQRCCPLSADQCDAKGRFIMNPSTGTDINTFSPCSIGNICSGLLRGAVRSECLTDNRGVTTITGKQCGNGIVEAGEDCDCGGTEGCGDNPCCNPTTCRFTDNSVCDPANEDCCTSQCRFAAAGAICRTSTGECDPQETCPGDSSICPNDKHKNDGASCGASGQGLQCASGQCTSRLAQCQAAVGFRDTRNDTTACANDCMITCKSQSAFETDLCVTMMQNFVDGTPCQSGGKCDNGVCKGASWTNWFKDNLHIVIPVAASVGGVIVLLLLCCCISSMCKKRRAKAYTKQAPTPPPMQSYNNHPTHTDAPQWDSNAARQAHQAEQYSWQQQQQQQYMAYQQQYQQQQQRSNNEPFYPGQWQPTRTASMRYA